MIELNISLVLYNTNEDELKRLFSSLEKQINVKFKLLILDNSLTRRNFEQYNFEVDYQKSFRNIGFGRAHNANYNRSELNSFFLVINPDVYFDDPLLLRKLIDKSENTGLSSVRILNPDGTIQEVHRLLPRFTDICRRFVLNKMGVYYPYKHTYTLSHIDKTKPFVCPNISGCFMLFSPGLFGEAKGFDEGLFLYFEDIDLSRRCYYLTNGNAIVHGDLHVYHTWKRQGYRNCEMFKIHVLSAVYYFQKYGIFRDQYSKVVNQQIERLSRK
jgi:GT2 family glycosyltransferase